LLSNILYLFRIYRNRIQARGLLSKFAWTLFFLCIFSVQQFKQWPIIRFSDWSGGRSFVDLRSVFHSADCSASLGWDIYNPSKWGDCGYIYGSLLIRFIRWCNLTVNDTTEIGWMFLCFFSVFCAYIVSSLKNLTKVQKIVCVMILVSPGSMLLLERANIDVLLLFFTVVAAFFLSKGHIGVGITFIALGALFKFYTLPLLYLLSFFSQRKKGRYIWLTFSLLVTIFIILDLRRIQGDFPRNVLGSFGNQIPGLYLNYAGFDFSRFYLELIGHCLLILCAVSIWLFLRKPLTRFVYTINLKEKRSFNFYLQVLLFFTFLICFFAGINYDYRLPYVLFPTLLFMGSFSLKTKQIWSIILVLLIISWASYNASWLQVLGDGVLLILVATQLVILILFLKRIVSIVRTNRA
jgi:hypothetical protein